MARIARTYADVRVSTPTWNELAGKLRAAGYEELVDEEEGVLTLPNNVSFTRSGWDIQMAINPETED